MEASHRPHAPAPRPRGVATIAVALVLLLGMTLVAFFTHRNLVLEQRSAIHHDRSARAFELAEGGLVWTTARLNDPRRLAAAPSCAPSQTGDDAFADRFVTVSETGVAALDRRAACHVAPDGSIGCACGAAADALPHTPAAATNHARFVVHIRRAAASDPWTVELTSRACTQAGPPCDDDHGAARSPDATASTRVLLRMRPAFAQAPGAAVLAAGDVAIAGRTRVTNADTASRGLTVVAGGRISLGADARLVSLPGTPAEASLVDGDEPLARLSSRADGLVLALLGESIDAHRGHPLTWTVTAADCQGRPRCSRCASPSECGSALASAHAKGFGRFWLDTPASLGGPAIGSERAAVIVVSSAPLALEGSVSLRGVLIGLPSPGHAWRLSSSGAARVHGAVASGGDLRIDGGTLDIAHDAAAFAPGRARGEWLRVPGSWTDRPDEP